MNNTEMIKELRKLTQAPMKNCCDALEESGFDLQKAVDIVKIKGLNIVSGRENKESFEGAVAISKMGNAYALVEVNCNTDFCAKSPEFIDFIDHAAMTLANKTATDQPFSVDDVKSQRDDLISATKENIVVRRWWVEQPMSELARTFTYVHPNYKIGVLLTLMASNKESINSSEFNGLGNDLAMQVAAMNPLSVSADKLDPEVVARQKAIFEIQLSELKKPKEALEKILDGKFNKYYKEVCLLDQESVIVNKTSIQQVIKNASNKLGCEIQVVTFIRAEVGEGIVQQKSNLENEVAKLL